MVPTDLWRTLDPDGPPRVAWVREPPTSEIPRSHLVVLLGAFDPPTNAHLDIVTAAARVTGAAPVLGLTKVRLARPQAPMLDDVRRFEVLDAIADRCRFGFAVSNRATYFDVHRALVAGGFVPTFVVGADKLDQLADPSFYPDGDRGVTATFEEVTFLVVPRRDIPVERPGFAPDTGNVRVLDPSDVFTDRRHQDLSATDVRRMVAAGTDVSNLVPPEVDDAIGGYTSAR